MKKFFAIVIMLIILIQSVYAESVTQTAGLGLSVIQKLLIGIAGLVLVLNIFKKKEKSKS